jgi:hypothetical protein
VLLPTAASSRCAAAHAYSYAQWLRLSAMVTYVHITESGGQQAMHRSLCCLAFIAAGLAFLSILGTYIAGSACTLDDFDIITPSEVPSHWAAEHITRYKRFMQFLQQKWDLCAAAEFATSLMINMRPWTPETVRHETAHAVTKQDLLGMANVELVDSSYAHMHAEKQALIGVIEVVWLFNGADHPLTNESSQAEIVAAFYSLVGKRLCCSIIYCSCIDCIIAAR